MSDDLLVIKVKHFDNTRGFARFDESTIYCEDEGDGDPNGNISIEHVGDVSHYYRFYFRFKSAENGIYVLNFCHHAGNELQPAESAWTECLIHSQEKSSMAINANEDEYYEIDLSFEHKQAFLKLKEDAIQQQKLEAEAARLAKLRESGNELKGFVLEFHETYEFRDVYDQGKKEETAKIAVIEGNSYTSKYCSWFHFLVKEVLNDAVIVDGQKIELDQTVMLLDRSEGGYTNDGPSIFNIKVTATLKRE